MQSLIWARSGLFVLALMASFHLCTMESRAQMVFNRGTASEPPTLDPNKAIAQSAAPIIEDMFLTLLETGPDLETIPGAAESWTASEDGLTYTFKLKPGLTWSDGVPLTADDFVYTFQRFLDPKTAATFASFLYVVENARAVNGGTLPPEAVGIAALDPLTVEIRLEQPVPYFLDLMARSTFSPVPRHAIEEHGNNWTRPGIMVSNGPYILAERVPQSHIKLVKNPLFHEADSVAIDEIYYYPTQDLQTAFNRFRAGELDFILSFPPDKIDLIRETMPDALRVVPALGSYFVSFQTQRPPFNDPRVRRAVSLAVDRTIITEQILGTGVRPGNSIVPAGFTGYTSPELEETGLSIEQRQQLARDLLSEAGYSAANPLRFTYSFDSQDESRKVAIALAAMWKAAGIEVELVDKEFRALIGDRMSGNFEALRFAFFSPLDDPYFFLELLESDNPGNSSRYSNPAFDEMLRQSNFIADRAERMEFLAHAD